MLSNTSQMTIFPFGKTVHRCKMRVTVQLSEKCDFCPTEDRRLSWQCVFAAYRDAVVAAWACEVAAAAPLAEV